MSQQPMIHIRELTRHYTMGEQEVRALDGVNLDVERGEFVAIMGPSGSGKSTLMNLLGCLDTPSSGSYVLNGQEVSQLDENQLAEIRNQEIGFIFQTFNLLGRTTALQNVELPLIYAGLGRSERRRLAEEALTRVDLADRMTHRPNDYHPDHRYTSQLVQDSSYLITVPNSAPEVEHLNYQPVMVYMSDTFKKPYPFTPDVVVEIDGQIDKKIDMLHAHASQMYEWIPYNQGRLDEVPADEADRKRWLKQWLKQTMVGKRSTDMAHQYRERLIERYGEQKAADVEYAEAYEECEYGAALDDEQIARLFGGM